MTMTDDEVQRMKQAADDFAAGLRAVGEIMTEAVSNIARSIEAALRIPEVVRWQASIPGRAAMMDRSQFAYLYMLQRERAQRRRKRR